MSGIKPKPRQSCSRQSSVLHPRDQVLIPSQGHIDQIRPVDGAQVCNTFPQDQGNPVPLFYTISKTTSELAWDGGKAPRDKVSPGPKE